MAALARKLQIRNVHAAEQPKCGQPRARLIFLFLRERLPALQLHLAENRFSPRALVADNQHVIDQNLLALVDGELQFDLRAVSDRLRLGADGDFLIPAIQIQQRQVVGISGNLRLEIGLAGYRS